MEIEYESFRLEDVCIFLFLNKFVIIFYNIIIKLLLGCKFHASLFAVQLSIWARSEVVCFELLSPALLHIVVVLYLNLSSVSDPSSFLVQVQNPTIFGDFKEWFIFSDLLWRSLEVAFLEEFLSLSGGEWVDVWSDVDYCETQGVLCTLVSFFERHCLVFEVLQCLIDLCLGVVLADVNFLKVKAFF